jgi:hypothetical protein
MTKNDFRNTQIALLEDILEELKELNRKYPIVVKAGPYVWPNTIQTWPSATQTTVID